MRSPNKSIGLKPYIHSLENTEFLDKYFNHIYIDLKAIRIMRID